MSPVRFLFKGPLKASGRQLRAGGTARARPVTWICRRCMSQQSAQVSPSSEAGSGSEATQQSTDNGTNKTPEFRPSQPQDLGVTFSQPTWSVRSLLPKSPTKSEEITPANLHHLLRLSALPLPRTAAEEDHMLATLQAQLQFVRDIQSVDTSGVEPLRSIRDETAAGVAEATITLDTLRQALSNETKVGYRRRSRRVRDADPDEKSREESLVEAATVDRREGDYFVVASGKGD